MLRMVQKLKHKQILCTLFSSKTRWKEWETIELAEVQVKGMDTNNAFVAILEIQS